MNFDRRRVIGGGIGGEVAVHSISNSEEAVFVWSDSFGRKKERKC